MIERLGAQIDSYLIYRVLNHILSSKLNKGDNCESLKNENNLRCEEICGCREDSHYVYLRNFLTV